MSNRTLVYRKISDNFLALALIEEATEAGTAAPKPPQDAPREETPVVVPPNPETPATAPAEPKNAEIRRLIQQAKDETAKLQDGGAKVSGVGGRLMEMEMLLNTQPEALPDLAGLAIREAQMMKEDQGVDTTAVVLLLMKIQTLVGGGGGTLVGGTDVAGDMEG